MAAVQTWFIGVNLAVMSDKRYFDVAKIKTLVQGLLLHIWWDFEFWRRAGQRYHVIACSPMDATHGRSHRAESVESVAVFCGTVSCVPLGGDRRLRNINSAFCEAEIFYILQQKIFLYKIWIGLFCFSKLHTSISSAFQNVLRKVTQFMCCVSSGLLSILHLNSNTDKKNNNIATLKIPWIIKKNN